MGIFGSILGDKKVSLRGYEKAIARIASFESEMQALTTEGFAKKTEELKARIRSGESNESILPEAYALVREAARRTLGERHYDVQMIGGIVMNEHKIAEMRTGEGKTLVATLPAYLNALLGDGVHIVTVNDYLSRRDAVWMGQVYSLLGLTVGVINGQNASYLYDPGHTDKDKERDELGSFKVVYEFLRPAERREAYAADITYGTNNEFGFDYLRDNLAQSKEYVVQRGHNFAIVDEIDSILIDEARTPLIISSPAEESEDFYARFAQISASLKPQEHYEVDEKLRAISLTDIGIEKAENILGIENIYTDKGIKYVHHLETALRAKALFQKDKDYVIKDGEIIIVDQFTGRLQPGRRYSEGLHQALEAKEGVKVNKESRTVASITFQNYFKMYKKLAGMTGTAETSSEEFFEVYKLDVASIPTNRETQRKDLNDQIFRTDQGKLKAIADKAKQLYTKGQPVLIGTISIEKNELLSAYLTQAGVPDTILNAKKHEEEGSVIAQAGRKGKVTIATNMAGRGVDIKLGGSPATKEEYEEVKSLGGLFVLGTERHEARRIDDQLRGRAGRQGDPGVTQFYVSLEDDLMRIFSSGPVKGLMERLNIPEDQPIENGLITKGLKNAQKRIEGFHFDARKHVLQYDSILSRQRDHVYGLRKTFLFGGNDELSDLLEDILEDNEHSGALKEKKEKLGEEVFFSSLRRVALYVLDVLWRENLETMEYLRSSVNLRAYGQRDPLVEYTKEGKRLFEDLKFHFKEETTVLLLRLESPVSGVSSVENRPLIAKHESKKQFETSAVESGSESKKALPTQSEEKKMGRNDLCFCGSGKKYKKCHGA